MGAAAIKRKEKKKWCHRVNKIVQLLRVALQADYVMLGGGNPRLLTKLPPRARLGKNAHAFEGGYRLWTARYTGSTSERFIAPAALTSRAQRQYLHKRDGHPILYLHRKGGDAAEQPVVLAP